MVLCLSKKKKKKYANKTKKSIKVNSDGFECMLFIHISGWEDQRSGCGWSPSCVGGAWRHRLQTY